MALSQSSPPSPSLLLECLSLHLRPTILYSSLPSALQIAAHLCLLAAQLSDECNRFLVYLANEVTVLNYQDEEVQVVKRLEKIGRGMREREERMWAFSLELRKYHLARVFSTKDVPMDLIMRLLKTYFPVVPRHIDTKSKLSTVSEADLTDHPMLFVRAIPLHLAETFRQYGDVVRKWHEVSRAAREAALPLPNTKAMLGDDFASKESAIAGKLMHESERIVGEIKEVEGIVASLVAAIDQAESNLNGGGSDGRAEAVDEGSPQAPVSINIERGAAQQSASMNNIVGVVAHSDHTQRNETTNFASGKRARSSIKSETRGSTRPRSLSRSPSPSPVRLAKLPRLSFSRHARRTSSVSVTRPDGTPVPRSPRTQSAMTSVQRSSKGKEREISVVAMSPSRGITSDRDQTALEYHHDEESPYSDGHDIYLPTYDHDRPSSSIRPTKTRKSLPARPIPQPKAKPRSSLPSLTGPDYTAPLTASARTTGIGANVDKANLRPFQRSKLSRRGFDVGRR